MTLEERINALLEHEMEFLAEEFAHGERAKLVAAARQEVKHYLNGIVDKWSPEATTTSDAAAAEPSGPDEIPARRGRASWPGA